MLRGLVKRYIALYLVAGSILLTVLTILLSWRTQMPLGEAMTVVMGAAFVGLLMMTVGYGLALLEFRRQKSKA